MTNKQRLDLIEQYIRDHKYADLHTLAEQFDISLSTVRRALNDLETGGLVRRHHGGASLVEEENNAGGYDFITQDNRQVKEKHAIAQAISSIVEPNMTIILDGGTTTYAVARMLVGKRIVVVTNSLPIAALFGDVGSSETIVTGGTVYSRLGILYGPNCEQALSNVHADIAILGSAGLTQEGIWNNNNFIISFQKRMMASSNHTYFAIDSAKHDKRNLHLSTPFNDTFSVVVDKEPSKATREAIDKNGTQLIIAK